MHRKRLDEILIDEGIITESQTREALLHQKVEGGKFGSQLLYLCYLTEAQLVSALSIQLECEGVVISEIDIPQNVVEMIPKEVAIARKVMPFEYDSSRGVLKIASENPADEGLIKDLAFVLNGPDAELYVAAEIALNTVIAKHYLGRDTALVDNLVLEIPDDAAKPDDGVTAEDDSDPMRANGDHPHVLLVTDEEYSAPLLQSILERNSYVVTIVCSTQEALEMARETSYRIVLVRNVLCEDMKDLADRIRGISPSTTVRFYTDISSLIFDDSNREADHLFLKNLDLLTSLLASEAKMPFNHSSQVGQYADRLCRRLRLPSADRLLIGTAGYLHDLAKFYYGTEPVDDNRQLVELTATLLASLGYCDDVISLLQSMYTDLEVDGSGPMSVQVLGGNILTVVDLFCHAGSGHERLSLDKLDAIKKRLRDLVGKLFLANVVESFIGMVQDEILNLQTSRRAAHIAIYYEESAALQPLDLRLRNEGFVTVPVNSVESLIVLFGRGRPDMILLLWSGKGQDVASLIASIESGGINLAETPAFLLAESSSIPLLTDALDRGLEDVVAVDGNLDLLVSKLRKLESRMGGEDSEQMGAGGVTTETSGRLADMNLIDLIQALGPGRKSLRIRVQPNDAEADVLTLHLLDGQVIFARVAGITGVEAVYEGLSWTEGSWQIDCVGPEDIPDPNIATSNESLLMEGCRLLDEKARAGHLL